MTNLCLKITAFDNSRSVWLYTCQTEIGIPVAIVGAIQTLANSWSCLAAFVKPKTVNEFLKFFRSVGTGLDYQPFVAGLVIAAMPSFLAPLTDAFRCDLPSWSVDKPYHLKVSEHRWLLKNESGQVIEDFDPTLRLAQALVKIAKGLKNGKKKSKSRKA